MGIYLVCIAQKLLVILAVWLGSGKHEAQQAANGIDVAAGVGLRKAILLGRGKAARAQKGGVARGAFHPHASNAQVNEVRAVGGDNNVARAQVAVDDPARVQRRRGLADVEGQPRRRCSVKAPAAGHQLFQGLARHVVVDNHKEIWQRIRGLDLGQPRAVQRADRRPNAAVGQLNGNLFAHKRAGAANGDKLGQPAGALREHTLHAIRVVKAYGMHDLLVVQKLPSSSARSRKPHPREHATPKPQFSPA